MSTHSIHVDIAVVGAGSAGVAAAIGAAQSGLTVALLEGNDYPGGKATAAMVGTVCGLYKTGAAEEPEWAVGGMARRFAEALARESGSQPEHFYGSLFFLPYRIEAFKQVCLHELNSSGVKCYWGAAVGDVQVEADRIVGLTVRHNSAELAIRTQAVVDCTGEAVVARMASADWVQGGENQAAARVFQLTGISEMPAEAIHFALVRALRKGVKAGQIPEHLATLSVVPGSYREGRAYFKLPLPEEVTNDKAQRAEMLTRSTAQVKEVVAFLSGQTEAFVGVSLTDLAPEVGFRTGFRPIGKDTLRESDVLQPKPHREGIANGAWPIEYWRPGEPVEMAYFASGAVYQIPAGCLESRNAKNLYFAGRNISATSRAQASARVMGTCLQTGYAAGRLAGAAVHETPRAKAIAEIRKELEID